jgi:two-component system sensor histidine kinase YesM
MARSFHTIHNRLFLLFLVSMLSLMLIVSALYYKRSMDQFQDKVGSIAQKNVSQTMQLLDLILEDYDSLSKSISANNSLLQLLIQPTPNLAVKAINERTITNILGSIYYSREDIVDIQVISYSGAIYNYEQNVLNIYNEHYAETNWYNRIKASFGEIVWLGIQPQSLVDLSMKRPIFAYGRQLYDLSSYKPIGLLVIEVEPKQIMSALINLRLGSHTEVYVRNKDSQMIASTTSHTDIPSEIHDIPLPADGNVVIEERSNKLIAYSKPSMADWTVVSLTPNQDLNVELNQMKQFFYIVVSVLVVVAIVISQFVSRTIASPLKRLIWEMREVEKGNFHGVLNVKSYEEINMLVSSFNHMVRRMDDLIQRVKLSSISEKNAQLQALQSQVNPHFLYNTLDMIYWMLDENENERLGKVVLSLSHMFRYSSQWDGTTEVSLRDEMTQIRHYLTIIETRLGGRFTADIQVEEAWLNVRVPKMTLQPIIENAVKHGLEPLDRLGVISVYTQVAGEKLQIIVSDNGMGMKIDTLLSLQNSLEEARSSAKREQDSDQQAANQHAGLESLRRGIGLQNLQRRLVYMFDRSYGLQVDSVLGEGTTVTISIPLESKGALDEHSNR